MTEFNSNINQIKYYKNKVLTSDEVRNNYLVGAKKCLLDMEIKSDGAFPVSLSVIPANNKIGNWNINSGTWKIVEGSPISNLAGSRYFQCITAGNLYTHHQHAYGSWYFSLNRVAATGVYYNFIADSIGTLLEPFGYAFGINSTGQGELIRTTGGGSSTVAISSASFFATNTKYDIWVTRKVDGTFTIWVKGGVYTEWTLMTTSGGANPGTDNTYTTNKYVLLQAGVSDQTIGIKHYLGAITIIEAINLGLVSL